MPVRKPCLVDTNVLCVSNGRAEQADLACFEAAVAALSTVRENLLLLDDGMRILDEYRSNALLAGQPGLGDAFLRWAWDNQANPSACVQVSITPTLDARMFEEFPNDPDLAAFDPSDRKFVAVALGSGLDPEILNAVDTDWWNAHEALARHGVRVRYLCPHLTGPG